MNFSCKANGSHHVSFVIWSECAGPIVLIPLSFTFHFSRQCIFIMCYPDFESCVVGFGGSLIPGRSRGEGICSDVQARLLEISLVRLSELF